eukprot:6180724-Pleurochrysis_carterae.AAC.1
MHLALLSRLHALPHSRVAFDLRQFRDPKASFRLVCVQPRGIRMQHAPPLRDWVELSDLRFDAIVGIRENEQRRLQPLVVNIRMSVDIETPASSGSLAETINYAAVAKQVVFMGQHGQWRLLESFATSLCRLLLIDPAPGEGRAVVHAVELRLSKPEALRGKTGGVPSVQLKRERAWVADSAMTIGSGVEVNVLEEAPASAAYRVCIAAGSSWPMPVDSAALVLAGSGTTSDASSLKPGDTLPHAALVSVRAGASGLAMLLAGRQLRPSLSKL